MDVLRGFDMFIIMGMAVLIEQFAAASGWNATWFIDQLHHAKWHGLRFYDTVFPLFLFLAGVSWPFSLARQRERGMSTGAIVRKIVRRGMMLSLLGFVYNGLLKLDFPNMIWGTVLMRIGLAWALAALLSVFICTRKLIILAVVVLLTYWGVCVFVAAPDAPGLDPLSVQGCFAGWVDRILMPGKLTIPGVISNQGILSTLPSFVTALLGIFSGEILRRKDFTGDRKAGLLGVGAMALVAFGCLMAFGFGRFSVPFNKILWSSSFTLVVGGYSAALLAIFYWLIDVKGWWTRTLFFQVIGVNSIIIYMANRIVNFGSIATFFFGGLAELLPSAWGRVVLTCSALGFQWVFLWSLYRKHVFLHV